MGHIDSIRGIAALLVAYLHTAEYFRNIPAVNAQGTLLYDIAFQLNLGQAGVFAFFAISGFVICPTLRGNKYDGARKFLISRFFRLFPAFWVSMLLFVFVTILWPGKAIDIPQILGNIPMLYSIFQVEPLMGLYWTLEVEIIFYFLCLILFLCGGLHKPLILFSVGLVLIGANQWIEGRLDIWNRIADALSMPWAYMPGNLAIMFWGGLFRIWYDDRQQRCALGTVSIPLVALVAALLLAIFWHPLVLMGTWVLQGKLWALHQMVSYPLGLGLFIVGSLYIKLNNRFLVWLGTISYSIYLLHPIAFFGLLTLINTKLPHWRSMHLSLYLLVCLLLSILLAGLVYYCVEKPAIKIGRYLQNR